MKRPHPGRVGLGALLAVAVLGLSQLAGDGHGAARPYSVHSDTVNADVAFAPVRTPSSLEAMPAPPEALTRVVDVVPTGRPLVTVPILMYHYVRDNPDPRDQLGFNLSVTPADFAAQMDWLERNGYHPVDFDDLRAYFLGQDALPARPVVITFDDGYRDLYTAAFPILLRHHFKAVAYLVAGFLGAPNNVTRDQVREMDLNGIEIGAHTETHIDLTRASDSELRHQLVDGRVDLERLVGHLVVDFCYPAGRFDARVVAAVTGAGYQTATTTQPGVTHSVADRFTWSRVRVSGGEGLDRFAADLASTEPSTPATVAIKPLMPPGAPWPQARPGPFGLNLLP